MLFMRQIIGKQVFTIAKANSQNSRNQKY